uniref:Nucleolar protein 8 n=1 Tax=Knipowitschia caucasica TaxID=637954 RepID=A0AAV2MIL3_KNICA
METRRLYVGGLSHSVTDKDLKDRFGKFGKVESVELKTRADEQGVPYKTFGYINITLSDSDLKKCQTVLNKSQWKGGTLQIEPAKESFLQRVSQERQEAARLSLLPPKPSPQQQILSSLRDAGVCDFTMKSAVPGTEIPGHKDWVVGKFGRVLPVMQLKRCHGDGAQTLKYDPSKYGHNLRVLALPSGPEATPTPVCKLTWALEGGDDEISRKRRGEFPPFTVSKKKSRPSSDRIGSCNSSSRPIGALQPPLNSQSDEEQQQVGDSSYNAPWPEDDTLEVVSTDFIQNEDECDSADTDEIFSSLKPQATPNKMAAAKIQKKTNGCRLKYDSTDDEGEKASGKKCERKVKKANKMAAVKKIQKSENKVEDGGRKRGHEKGAKGDKEKREMIQGGTETAEETSQGGKESTEETSQEGKEVTEETGQGETDDSDSDHDYESLFSNVMRLEMSLCDLRMLAHRYAPETPAPAILSVDDTSGTPKTGTTPEEILEAILQGGSSDEEENKRRKKRKRGAAPEMSLPAFKGTGALQIETQNGDESSSAHTEASTDEEEDEGKTSEKESSSSAEASAQPATANRRKTALEEAELQRKANERRLAAVTQRQKEAEQNRRLIQGALYTREGTPGGSGGKHIVFGSDDEEEEEPLSANQNKIQTLSAPRLFDSDESEEDEERLEIRAEFEGSVGQKLMALQSRFGADERFRMDGRFLDDAEEECSESATAHTAQQGALQQEKQKNLNILHSVLGPCSTVSTPGEGNRAKALTFRETTSALFFFCANDPRLTDGPQWFCRTSLDKQRESWDQTRTQLRQDCKKKHKDARRKLRGSFYCEWAVSGVCLKFEMRSVCALVPGEEVDFETGLQRLDADVLHHFTLV